MKKLSLSVLVLIALSIVTHADTFDCRLNNGVSIQVVQSSNNDVLTVYDRDGLYDTLYTGTAKGGYLRWYGSRTTFYNYKNVSKNGNNASMRYIRRGNVSSNAIGMTCRGR